MKILAVEIGEQVGIQVEPVEAATLRDTPAPQECLFVALTTRAAAVSRHLAPGAPFFARRLRSIRGSLEGQPRPAPHSTLMIVSRCSEFRQWARAILIAVGLEPDCLCEVDATIPEWQQRIQAGTLAICDVAVARHLPSGFPVKAFGIIADSCVAELQQMCGNPAVTPP